VGSYNTGGRLREMQFGLVKGVETTSWRVGGEWNGWGNTYR